MERSLDRTQRNTPSKVIHWWADPFLSGFGLLYGTGVIVSFSLLKEWEVLGLIVIAITLSVLFLSRRYAPQPVDVKRPYVECCTLMGWYISLMLLSTISKGAGFLDYEFSKWLSFVSLPLIGLWVVRGRKPDVNAVLQSVGFRRQGLGRALLLGLLASLFMAPLVFMALPASQLQELREIFQNPWNFLTVLPAGFILALLTAGFTEEVFFRGMLQSRLAAVTGSEMRSCVLAAFLFGIYHLPYAYFSASWPTHGNIIWAFSMVLTEQMMIGLLLGVLWLRTHNIAAPILLHSLFNTLAIITMLDTLMKF